MRITAVFESDFFVQRNGHSLWCLAHVGNLFAHPASNHAVVMRRDTKGLGSKSLAQSGRGATAVGFHICNEVGELTRRCDHSDKGVILGSSANHSGATDVNVFDTNIERLPGPRDGFEGVEVGDLMGFRLVVNVFGLRGADAAHQQVCWNDAVVAHGFHMCGG